MSRSPSRLLFAAAAVAIHLVALSISASPSRADDANSGIVAKGQYLATMGDCISCHTPPDGKPFQGGMAMQTPFGTIYPPNITPDKETGIGNWSDDEFYAAMHEGLGLHGSYLYPVFPFPWYTKVTRDDALAIKAYLFTLEAVHSPTKPVKFSFPFNIRDALLAWRVAFFKSETFAPDPKKSAEENRGAYIVEGLGHCGECHNRSKLTGVTDLSGRLEGGEIQGWYAPNITSDGKQGVGSWSTEEIVTFLRKGIAPGGGVVFGPMKEVVYNSTSKMTDEDLKSIAAYLKSFPADKTYQPSSQDQAQVVAARGADDYLSHCATCHGVEGQGLAGKVPPLVNNGGVTTQGPENVIRVSVGGLLAEGGRSPMPAAAASLSDQQVADIANYVRTAWGNKAPANAEPGLVAKLRKETPSILAASTPAECSVPDDANYIAKGIDQEAVRAAVKGVQMPDLLEKIDDLVPKMRASDPQAGDDKIINAMIQAYCPLAMGNDSVPLLQRRTDLGNFATLVYGRMQEIKTGAK